MINCFSKLLQDNKISEDVFNTLKQEYDKTPNMSPDDMISKIDNNINRHKQEYTTKAVELDRLINLKSGVKSEDDFIDLIVKPLGGTKSNKTGSVESHTNMLKGEFLAPISRNMEELQSKLTWKGFKAPTQILDNISAKIFNKDIVVDKQITDIVKNMEESLKRSNDALTKAGLTPVVTDLSQLANLSQSITHMSPKDFSDFVRPLLQGSTEEIDKAISTAYRHAEAGEEVFKFAFKSTDAEKIYRDRIGGDGFSNLVSYLDRQASKIASTKIFGNNAENTITKLAAELNRDGIPISDGVVKKALNMYQHQTNTASQVKNPNIIAKSLANLRSLGTSTMMGSAILPAVFLDTKNIILTARYNGHPIMQNFNNTLKVLVSGKDRLQMSQMGFILDAQLSYITNLGRLSEHSSYSQTLDKLSTTVLRVTGLPQWSQAAKLGTKLTYLTHLRHSKDIPFKDLAIKDKKLIKQLQAYSIDEASWDTIRKSMTKEDLHLDPTRLTDDVKHLVYRMVNEEADYAVISPGARAAYYSSGLGQEKGSVIGEAAKSGTQFMSSVLEENFTHMMRIAHQSGYDNKVAYAAQFFVLTTILGGMLYQVKELANGKTPIDPSKDPLKFFANSVKEGGSLGFVSAPFVQHINPQYFDKGVAEQVLGFPSLQKPYALFEGVLNISANTYNEAFGEGPDAYKAQQKIDKAQVKLFKDVTGMVPGQNIAYTKAIYNEYVKEFGARLIDEREAKKSARNKEKQMKENGQRDIFKF